MLPKIVVCEFVANPILANVADNMQIKQDFLYMNQLKLLLKFLSFLGEGPYHFYILKRNNYNNKRESKIKIINPLKLLIFQFNPFVVK